MSQPFTAFVITWELLPPAGDAYDKVTTWWDIQNSCQIF